MKLLNVIYHPVYGGPHNEVLRSGRALADRGWDSVTVLPDEPGSAADRLRAAGQEVVELPLQRVRATADPRLHVRLALGFGSQVRRIRDVIRERDVDVVKVSGLLCTHAGIAARLEDRPVVWEIIDSRPPAAVRIPATWIACRLADVLLFDGRALVDVHGGPARFRQPWFTYYPPVDTSTFRPDPDAGLRTRRTLGIPPEARVVGTVANLNPQKGLEYLIRAAGRIFTEIGDLWLLVVGSSYPQHRGYEASIEAEVRRSGLRRERVVFTGGVPDPQHYYPAMDVKLVTSLPRSEGTTTTAIEAQACGVPVVATDVGAVGEVVWHGRTGLLVPPRDPAAIAAATVQLLQDDGRRRAFSELAERQARRRFGVEGYTEALLEAFEAARRWHRGRRGSVDGFPRTWSALAGRDAAPARQDRQEGR